MKKAVFAMGISVLLILGSVMPASAHGPRTYSPAKNYLTFSSVFSPSQLGYKHHLGKNLYATGDMLFENEQNSLRFRVGGAYHIPVKILFFRLYAASGYQFSRDNGNQFPYVAVGSHFWFLFTEVAHPLESRADPEYRLGFSVKF
jgi:hypothetical protein